MRTEVPLLTKSDYLAGMHCAKRLYLRKFHSELDAPPSEGAKARMADGIEIGEYARRSFPGGVLIDTRGQDGLTATRVLMETAHTLFEAQFVAKGLLARVDVLQREGDGWRVIEVKSSKEPKDGDKFKNEHLDDLAFQVFVLREAGANITGASLMLLSRDYSLGSERDLFTILDCTKEVEKRLLDAQMRSTAMLEVLSRQEPPEIETNIHCDDCGFYAGCHKAQEIDDLVFLPRIKANQVTDLRRNGITRIGEIDNGFKLSTQQVTVRNVFRDNKPYIGEGLRAALEKVEFPIHFIDFETAKWVIPVLPGTTSHEAFPFQWSCHMLPSIGAACTHSEFLFRRMADPREEFARTLWECVREGGSIFVYSHFEMGVLKALDRNGIPAATELCEALTKRGVDLLKIVQDHVYHPNFQGSFSIKTVLPALVPSMNYKDLVIREGDSASAEIKRMVSVSTPADLANEIAHNLLQYCRRDTEAMVALYFTLCQLCGLHTKPLADDTRHDQLMLNI